MNFTVELDAEELDALTEAASLNNYNSAAELGENVIKNHVTSLVLEKRIRVVDEIGKATNSLPYDKRTELAQINRTFITEALSG